MRSRQGDDGRKRVMLFSHDSYGLGHLRRSLTIAESLCRRFTDASVLLVTGSPCASHFPVPAGVEVVKLPSATKDDAGDYVPRTLRGGVELLRALRRVIVTEAFHAFRPDLVLVDHQPLGLDGELLELLREARAGGVATVLGMRDIIDEPEVVARHWSHPDVREALRGLYERVVVYGAPEVFDTRAEYPIPPELGERVEYAGYVVRPGPARSGVPRLRPHVLVTMGGGEDGEASVRAWLELHERGALPWDSTVVLGPLLHPERARHLKRRARRMQNVRVRGFYADMPRLLSESDAVLSMAGYNTVSEILQSRVPAVLVPRTYPRREQLMRAQRLEGLGLVRCVTEVRPRVLRDAVEEALTVRRDWTRVPPLDGDRSVARLIGELLDLPLGPIPASARGAQAS